MNELEVKKTLSALEKMQKVTKVLGTGIAKIATPDGFFGLWNEAEIETAEAIQMLKQYDSPTVNWDEAPDWAQWFAIDKNGIGAFFEKKPYLEGAGWSVDQYELFHVLRGRYSPHNWKNSLTKRPA